MSLFLRALNIASQLFLASFCVVISLMLETGHATVLAIPFGLVAGYIVGTWLGERIYEGQPWTKRMLYFGLRLFVWFVGLFLVRSAYPVFNNICAVLSWIAGINLFSHRFVYLGKSKPAIKACQAACVAACEKLLIKSPKQRSAMAQVEACTVEAADSL